jgi:hypothetical protein
MATEREREWTASIVIGCSHAGLRPYFKALEAEFYRVLSRVDEPRAVIHYLQALRMASGAWLGQYEIGRPEK